jgi:hypothetical protein
VSKGEALKSAEGPEWGVDMVSWAEGKGPQKTNCAQLWGRVGYSEKNAPSPFPIVSKGEALKSAEGPEWGVGMVSWAGHRKGEGPSKNQLFSTLG